MLTAILVGVPSSIVPRIRKHVGLRVAIHALPMIQKGGFRLEAPPQEAARQITDHADRNSASSYEKVLVLLLPYAKPPKEVSDTANVLHELGAIVEKASLDPNVKAEPKWPSLAKGIDRYFEEKLVTALCEFLDKHFPPPAGSDNLPARWEDFADWCAKVLRGRLTLSNKAQQQVKSAYFKNPVTAAHALLWLAGEYRTSRIECSLDGSNLKKNIGNGLHNELCGADAFKFTWNGTKVDVTWHIKNMCRDHDRTRVLRIYYFWDEPSTTVVIAEMPEHRVTAES